MIKDKSNKKALTSLIIGIVVTLILIIGATYAYFNAGTIVNSETSFISYSTGTTGSILLNGTSSTLYMNLVLSDMGRSNNNKEFYASTTGKKTTPTMETVGIATVTSRSLHRYRCTFDLEFTHSGANDLIDRFFSSTNDEFDYENKSDGQLFLIVNGTEYDLNNGWPTSLSGSFEVDYLTPGEIKVGFKFVNLKSTNQDFLENTTGVINVNVVNDSFKCAAIDDKATYWAYEPNTSTGYVTSATAHKALSYEELTPLSINLIHDELLGIYYNNNNCQEALEYNASNSQYNNLRCVNNLTDYYIMVEYNTWDYGSYDSESSCRSAIGNSDEYKCYYYDYANYWYASFPTATKLFFSENECVAYGAYEEYHNYKCAPSTADIYYLFYEANESFQTMDACEYELENPYPSINCYYCYDNEMASSVDYINSRCVADIPKVFVREKKTITEITADNNPWFVYDRTGTGLYEWSINYESCNSNLANSNIPSEYNPSCVQANPYYLYVDDYIDGIYDDLSECEDEADYYDVYGITGTCVKNNASGYVIEYLESSTNYSSESDCEDDYSGSSDPINCKYDGDYWHAYREDIWTLTTTLTNCEALITYWSYDSNTSSCVHPSYEKYYLYLDNYPNGTYSNQIQCEADIPEYTNFSNYRCVQGQIIKIYADDYMWDYYDSEADCEDEIDYLESRPYCSGCENMRCVANTASDYVVKYYVSWEPSFDTESDCTSYIDGWSNAECIYNSSTNKWDIYRVDVETLSSSLADCQAMISASRDFDSSTSSCVHPNFEYYFLYIDNYDWGNFWGSSSISVCEDYAEDRFGDNASCEVFNNYVIEYNDPAWVKFNSQSDCMDYLVDDYYGDGNFNSPVCKTKYQNGDIVYITNTEICGVIDDGYLCYSPFDIEIEDFESIMSDELSCEYQNNNEELSCENSIYESSYISNPYYSHIVSKNGRVECSYDLTNNLRCGIDGEDPVFVESEHYPYPNNMNYTVYYEHTFEGAKSLTVDITYGTQYNYDYVYIYGKDNTYLYWGSNSELFTIPSNYIKITFYSNSSNNNYYGFSATITPNY